MNTISLETQKKVIAALVDGCSIRATCRIAGVAKGTVLSLLKRVGQGCADYQDVALRELSCARIQADEVHSFVRCKQPRVTPEKAAEGFCGDAWTYTALDPDSKLIVTWEIGKRGEDSARRFMKDLAARLLARPQVSTDANTPYLVAVFGGFGQEVDYAQVVKRYGHKPEDKDHFQAPRCIGVSKKVVQGDPDPKHISTSFVERSNLTLRMGSRRFTRKTNGFSKKLENLKYAVALHFFYYNFCRPHMSLNGATPAMAAGKATAVWGLDDILKVSKAN